MIKSIRMDYAAYLQHFGIRPSESRIAVLKDLDENRTHATVDEIFARLKEQQFSLATIYNTLNLLSQKNIIRAIKIENTIVRYDFDNGFHAHFQCTKCGKIIDIPIYRRPSLQIPADIKITQEDYFIYGLCADCQK